jgi:hypothetical protein
MKPEEWNQIDELLQQALNKAPGDRAAFLDQISDGKGNIRREVESLLAHHDRIQSFLEQPPAEVAAELLTSGKSRLLKGQFIRHSGSSTSSEPAAWVRFISPRTPGSIAPSRSKCLWVLRQGQSPAGFFINNPVERTFSTAR